MTISRRRMLQMCGACFGCVAVGRSPATSVRITTFGKTRSIAAADLSGLQRYVQSESRPRRGRVVNWTGVRFGDFVNFLRIPASSERVTLAGRDGYRITERRQTLMSPEVLIVQDGERLRLVIPFQRSNRSIKDIQEISFT